MYRKSSSYLDSKRKLSPDRLNPDIADGRLAVATVAEPPAAGVFPFLAILPANVQSRSKMLHSLLFLPQNPVLLSRWFRSKS